MHNFVKNAHLAETIAYFKHTSMLKVLYH